MKNFKARIEDFIKVSMGNTAVTVEMTKFGTIIIGLIILIVINILLGEFAIKNRELKKEKSRVLKLEEDLKKRDKELEELREFRQLMKAIKDISRGKMNENEVKIMAQTLYKASKNYKMDWRMITAVVMVESDFDRLLEYNNSYGLMQIRFMTGQEIGGRIGVDLASEQELHGIKKNLELGSFYLFEQIVKFGDIKKGLMAYNMGPNKLRSIYKKIGSKKLETAYVRVVFKHYNNLKKNY